MRLQKTLLVSTALFTVLATTAVVASPNGKAIKSLVENRFNEDLYPELTNPCDPADSDCYSTGNDRSFDLSADAAYWGAWRTSLGDGGTTNIDVCGPHAGIWSFWTWNGEVTGSIARVLEKMDAITATVTLNGQPLRVLQESPATWENRIDSTESGGRRIVYPCEDYMTVQASDALEPERNAGEYCWSTTFGVDLSNLPEGSHQLVTNFELGKNFIGADSDCINYDVFDDDTPCSLTYTRTINVNVPGGCKGNK